MFRQAFAGKLRELNIHSLLYLSMLAETWLERNSVREIIWNLEMGMNEALRDCEKKIIQEYWYLRKV